MSDTPNTKMSTKNTDDESITINPPQLVRAERLLEILFDQESRPSLRWLRQMQAQRKIPYVKLGHLVRFNVDNVRKAIEEDCTVHSRAHLRRR
jgi:hypothetical protein